MANHQWIVGTFAIALFALAGAPLASAAPTPAAAADAQRCSLVNTACADASITAQNYGCSVPTVTGSRTCTALYVWQGTGSGTAAGILTTTFLDGRGAQSRQCSWTLPGSCSTQNVYSYVNYQNNCNELRVSATVKASTNAALLFNSGEDIVSAPVTFARC